MSPNLVGSVGHRRRTRSRGPSLTSKTIRWNPAMPQLTPIREMDRKRMLRDISTLCCAVRDLVLVHPCHPYVVKRVGTMVLHCIALLACFMCWECQPALVSCDAMGQTKCGCVGHGQLRRCRPSYPWEGRSDWRGVVVPVPREKTGARNGG